jgi:tRNA pseudouridine55 synthase
MEHPEILLIDKPSGMTSFDVVYKVRRTLNPKPKKDEVSSNSEPWVRLRVGHAGTLDPLATGLMIIGIGKGTKKLTELVKLDKEYIAEVRIGEQRTTGDLEGDIIQEKDTESIPAEEVASAVASLVGIIRLPVSAYSAIKIDGKPMYKRAREAEKTGEVVTDVPMRDMVVHEAEIVNIKNIIIRDSEEPEKKRVVVTVRFFVASGVYIRSLGEELGKRLGYPATLQNLQRTKVGDFSIENAQSLDELVN